MITTRIDLNLCIQHLVLDRMNFIICLRRFIYYIRLYEVLDFKSVSIYYMDKNGFLQIAQAKSTFI